MSARSRDIRRFDPLAEAINAAWLDMGKPSCAEYERRAARIYLADMPAERRAQLERDWTDDKRSCA